MIYKRTFAFALFLIFVASVDAVSFTSKSKALSLEKLAKGHRNIQSIRGGGGIFQEGKVHPWFGTSPLFKPLAYPIVDALLQLATGLLAYCTLTGAARKAAYAIFGVHFVVYILTNYGAKSLSLALLPLKIMYIVDIGLTAFFVVAPFVLEGFGDWKWCFVIVFGLAAAVLVVFDPEPELASS